jgi:hypothetical protein
MPPWRTSACRGAPAFHADVAVQDGKIVGVGKRSAHCVGDARRCEVPIVLFYHECVGMSELRRDHCQ